MAYNTGYRVVECIDDEKGIYETIEDNLTLELAENILCWHCNCGVDAYLQYPEDLQNEHTG